MIHWSRGDGNKKVSLILSMNVELPQMGDYKGLFYTNYEGYKLIDYF